MTATTSSSGNFVAIEQPRPTREQQGEDTRRRLLAATVKVLLKKGYSAFRVADAAAAAGVSRGAQSHHFPTKDALIEAAIEAVFDQELEASQAAAAGSRSDEILKAAASFTANFLNSDQYYMTLQMLVSAVDNPLILEKTRTIASRIRQQIEGLWRDRLVGIGLRSDDAEDVLWLLWGVLRDVALRHRLWDDRGREDRVTNLALELLDEHIRSLAKSPAPIERGRKGLRRKADNRSVVTRKKLLDAALKIIGERGYARLRSADISDVAGVSRGGQLHHFPSKDDIVVAAFEHIFLDVSAERGAVLEALRERIVDCILEDAQRYYFTYRFRAVLDVLMSNSDHDQLVRKLREAAKRQGQLANETWVQQLCATGVEPEAAQDCVWFLRGVVHGLAIRGFVSRDQAREQRVTSVAARLALAHLKRHQPPSASRRPT